MERAGRDASPWGVVLVLGSLAFLVAGILWPGTAAVLLRVFILCLAIGWFAARGTGVGVPSKTVYDTFSPFDGAVAETSSPPLPDVVERRARWLAAVDDPHGGAHRSIPWPVAQDLIRETARRLEARRSMRLDRPDDVARLRDTFSESTCRLLGIAHTDGAANRKQDGVPLAKMDDILNDLERL